MPIPKTERLKLTRTPDRRDAGIREKIALASELNEHLRSGTGIAELSDLLRQVVRPILVDFNNVLVDNTSKYVPNMKALAPFAELQKIGTVVVLTAAGPWSAVHRALCRSGFWTSYVILILPILIPSRALAQGGRSSALLPRVGGGYSTMSWCI